MLLMQQGDGEDVEEVEEGEEASPSPDATVD